MTVSQAVAQQARPSLAQTVEQMRPEIARALPKHMDADRMARLALTTIRQTPKLAECTPASFLGALLTASALGLEPGINGEAYLVPHGRECTLIIGYAGMVKLYYQHPDAKHIDAHAVYEHDEFDYAYGLDPFLTHKPARGDRGKLACFYGVASLKSGAQHFVVLTPDEIKALRGGKVGASGGIPDPMRWMERKTALRQLLKMLPKSTTLNMALAVDERSGSELSSAHVPESITSGSEVINLDTGEVHEGELVDADWPEAAQVKP